VDLISVERGVGLPASKIHDRQHRRGVFRVLFTSVKLKQHDLGVVIVVNGTAQDAFFMRVLKRIDVFDAGAIYLEFLGQPTRPPSKEKFEQIVQPAGQHEFAAGVLHDFLNLLAITRVVAVLGAMLACRLGVERTRRSLHERVRQQLGAFTTQTDFFAHQRRNIVRLDVNRHPSLVSVLVAAVDVDEVREQAQIAVQRFIC